MTWLVFGVSCLLVLAGAASIISGAPIIQLERGWAEVISGTVALSSGGIVFALAGVLMRLEAIRDAMVAQMLPVAAERVPGRAAASVAEALEAPLPPPAPALPDAQPAEPAADAAAGRSEGLWKRIKTPAVERSTEPQALRQHGFPDRIVPEEEGPAPPRADTPVVVPSHAVSVEGEAPPVVAATAMVKPSEDAPPAERDAGQIGWLERSLFRARTDRQNGDADRSRAEPGAGTTPTGPASEQAMPSAPPLASVDDLPVPRPALFPVLEPTAAAEPAPTPDLASEQHEGASVVGRYQAGSASYVMYSDGTIEVETESGEMHRFDSMEELKTFIAQQDTTVS